MTSTSFQWIGTALLSGCAITGCAERHTDSGGALLRSTSQTSEDAIRMSEPRSVQVTLVISGPHKPASLRLLVIPAYRHLLNAPLPDQPWDATVPAIVQYLTQPLIIKAGGSCEVLLPPLILSNRRIRGEILMGLLVIGQGCDPQFISDADITRYMAPEAEGVTSRWQTTVTIEPAIAKPQDPNNPCVASALGKDHADWSMLLPSRADIRIWPSGEVLLRFSQSERSLIAAFRESERPHDPVD